MTQGAVPARAWDAKAKPKADEHPGDQPADVTGIFDAPPPRPSGTDPELLVAASILLADAAATMRQAGLELSDAVTGWRFGLAAIRRPAWALSTAATVAKALVNSAGLGFAVGGGGPAGEAARTFGLLIHRRPAAVDVAVDAFAMRIRAAAAEHPNLDAVLARRVVDAIVAGKRIEAVLAMRALMEDMGVVRAMTTISPVLMELTSLLGLRDESPFNDDFAWVTLSGTVPATDPIFGLPTAVIGLFNPGPGRAERTEADPILAKVLAGSRNDIASFLEDIGALGNHGLVLLRRIRCDDGAVRYAVLLPGTSFGRMHNSTPQNLIGSIDGLLRSETTYTRAVRQLLLRAGVEPGAELMLVGHSLGGMTAMNLAVDPSFAAAYRLTHVIAIGSPIDNKRPADPLTKVISLVNEHDIIPGMDGRGPASPNDIPSTWEELSWRDESFDYPLSHSPQAYAGALRGPVAHYRSKVNGLIREYDGEIVGNQPYKIRNR